MIVALRPNYAYVTAEKALNDELELNENTLYFDPTFNPQKHSVKWGVVTASPWRYTPEFVTTHYNVADIKPKVSVGDVVYFHYNTLLSQDVIKHNGKTHYPAHIAQIYAVAHPPDGKEGQEPDASWYLEPVGDWVILQKDNSKPTGEAETDDAVKVGLLWIPKSAVPKEENTGKIVNIGPMVEGGRQLQPGDTVYHRENGSKEITMAGATYHVIRQFDILGTL